MSEPQTNQVPLTEHLHRLRQQGRLDEARALIRRLPEQRADLAPLARRLLNEHDSRWWSTPTGRRCHLRRRGPQDLAFVRRLWAAPGFVEHFNPGASALPGDDATLARILSNEYAALVSQSAALHWTIETLGGEPFGMLSLTGISVAHRRAELLIGVHEAPYRGAAAEATLLAIDFAFGPMKLNKLVGLVPAHNRPSLEASAHIGFRSEGTLRQHIVDPRTREPVDLVHMALFADDDQARRAQQRVRRRLLGAAQPP